MAVLIASDLAKDMAGEPLLRGVSFKLERRDRLTIAGRNGAGKTTLLRMLAGETSIDGGELVLAKGTRVALHDQRPPRDRDLSLREYVLSGLPGAAGARGRAGPPRAGDGDRRRAGARPLQRRLRALRGGRRLRLARARAIGRARPRLRRRRPRPPAAHLLRRPAHARVAGARARRPARPAAARRAHQPPRHRVARVARADAARRSTPPSSWSPTTAGSWRRSAPPCSSSRPGRSRFFKGTWAQLAPRAGGARDGARARRSRSSRPRSSAWSASSSASATRRRRRAQAQSRVKKLDKMERIERDPRDGRALGFEFKPPERSGRVIFELEDGAPGGRAGRGARATAPSCGSSAASTSRWSGPTARARRR